MKAFYWTLVEHMYARGWGKLYGGPVTGARHWGYVLVCVCLLDYLHDTWFYWTHRLLHWRPVYKWVHWEHHRWARGGRRARAPAAAAAETRAEAWAAAATAAGWGARGCPPLVEASVGAVEPAVAAPAAPARARRPKPPPPAPPPPHPHAPGSTAPSPFTGFSTSHASAAPSHQPTNLCPLCTTHPYARRSKAPSPFTGYAFHVAEALLVFANEVLLPFCFPLHMGLHRIYHLLTTLIHEGAPRRRFMISCCAWFPPCSCARCAHRARSTRVGRDLAAFGCVLVHSSVGYRAAAAPALCAGRGPGSLRADPHSPCRARRRASVL